MELAIFVVFAALALAGSLLVVLGRNPVHCALGLVLALVSVAVFFLQQDAQLLAAVQVIVYAGAVVVLFLFVIMLLGVDREEALVEPLRYQRPAAIALGVIVFAEVLFLAGRQWATGLPSQRGALDDPELSNIEVVARTLFTDFLWPFEITAALLVIAVVGGVVLARRSGQPVDVLDAPDPGEAAEPSTGEPSGEAQSEEAGDGQGEQAEARSGEAET